MQSLSGEIFPVEPGERKWYEIWWDIWRHPREEAFQRLLKERDHSRKRAFIWILITSVFLGGYAVLFVLPGVFSVVTQSSLSQFDSGTQLIVGSFTILLTLGLAIAALLIVSGLLHVVAPAFSGYGKWGDLIICISAIMAPYGILAAILSSLDIFIIQRIGIRLITLILFLAMAFYSISLLVNSLKAAENLNTGSALATLLVPGVIISVIGLCCSGQFIATLMGGS